MAAGVQFAPGESLGWDDEGGLSGAGEVRVSVADDEEHGHGQGAENASKIPFTGGGQRGPTDVAAVAPGEVASARVLGVRKVHREDRIEGRHAILACRRSGIA